MTNFKIMAHSILFVLFAIIVTGCSSSSSSSSGSSSLQLSPETEFDFGTVTVGNSAAALEVTITNNGSVRLDISSIALSDTINFSLDENAGSTPCVNLSTALETGESCTVEVSFDPQEEKVFTATLTITSNDAGSPEVLTLKAKSELQIALKVTINQVDTLNCPTVVAYVSVTDQVDFPVAGLLTANFNVTEDSTDLFAPTTAAIVNLSNPISIALVMDNSSSMQPIDIVEMNDAANIIINQLVGTDMAEIIKFNSTPVVKQAFISDKSALKLAVADNLTGTGTALYDALRIAIADTAGQASIRKAVIAITDGLDSTDPSVSASLQEVIDEGKAAGVPVFVIGLGVDVDLDKLGQIASGTSGELYEANVAQNLGTIIQKQLSATLFDDQYVLTYTSPSAGGGAIDLTVEVTSPDFPSPGSHTREFTACDP